MRGRDTGVPPLQDGAPDALHADRQPGARTLRELEGLRGEHQERRQLRSFEQHGVAHQLRGGVRYAPVGHAPTRSPRSGTRHRCSSTAVPRRGVLRSDPGCEPFRDCGEGELRPRSDPGRRRDSVPGCVHHERPQLPRRPRRRSGGGGRTWPILLSARGWTVAATAGAHSAASAAHRRPRWNGSGPGPQTFAALAQYTDGPVVRIGGADRFSTAALIAQEFATPPVERVFIANGLNYADALRPLRSVHGMDRRSSS